MTNTKPEHDEDDLKAAEKYLRTSPAYETDNEKETKAFLAGITHARSRPEPVDEDEILARKDELPHIKLRPEPAREFAVFTHDRCQDEIAKLKELTHRDDETTWKQYAEHLERRLERYTHSQPRAQTSDEVSISKLDFDRLQRYEQLIVSHERVYGLLTKAERELAELKARNERLEWIAKQYKHHGTDGCSSCDSGRITLFYTTDKCLSCAPEDYVNPFDRITSSRGNE